MFSFICLVTRFVLVSYLRGLACNAVPAAKIAGMQYGDGSCNSTKRESNFTNVLDTLCFSEIKQARYWSKIAHFSYFTRI